MSFVLIVIYNKNKCFFLRNRFLLKNTTAKLLLFFQLRKFLFSFTEKTKVDTSVTAHFYKMWMSTKIVMF